MQDLATVEIIHSIIPHPNADKLELAKIRGFQVIVKKDDFKHGDKVVFVHPDTIARPAEWNKFLQKAENRDIRIKSVKLRGEFSTGVVLAISVLGDGKFEVGEPVHEVLGVSKYLKDTGNEAGSMNPAGSFPTYLISKTDEDNALSYTRTQEEFVGKMCYTTLKCDGQSFTAIQNEKEADLIVCSRNLSLKKGDNRFWNVAEKYDLQEKFKKLDFQIAVQGELCGPGIQGNKMQLIDNQLFVFDIKNLVTGKYFTQDEMVRFCFENGLHHVPILNTFLFDKSWSFDKLQEMADDIKYKDGHYGEGIVLRTVEPVYSATLRKKLSVKFINRNYKD